MSDLESRVQQLESRLAAMRVGTPSNPTFETWMLDRTTNQVYRVFVKNGTLTTEKVR